MLRAEGEIVHNLRGETTRLTEQGVSPTATHQNLAETGQILRQGILQRGADIGHGAIEVHLLLLSRSALYLDIDHCGPDITQRVGGFGPMYPKLVGVETVPGLGAAEETDAVSSLPEGQLHLSQGVGRRQLHAGELLGTSVALHIDHQKTVGRVGGAGGEFVDVALLADKDLEGIIDHRLYRQVGVVILARKKYACAQQGACVSFCVFHDKTKMNEINMNLMYNKNIFGKLSQRLDLNLLVDLRNKTLEDSARTALGE